MLGGMTEEAKPTAATEPAPPPQPEPTPAPAQAPPKYEINAPLVWTRGGTTTSSFDKHIAEEHAKGEALRAEHDEDRRAVREDGAKMYSHEFGSSRLDPMVLLHYDNAKWGKPGDMLAELLEDDVTGDKFLVIVCLSCRARGIPEDLCQLRVSSANRRWFVDTKERGQPGRYVDAFGRKQVYVKAGSIMDTDIIRCGQAFCDFKIRIHRDIIYPA